MNNKSMKLDFKKWTKGNSKAENDILNKIDSEFGKFIDKLSKLEVERESIFIYGVFNLLEYVHINRDKDLFNRLIILLESYIIFLRMRTRYKEFPLPPANIMIKNLGRNQNISFETVIDYQSDGSGECYNLISSLSEYLQSINIEKQRYEKNFGIFEKKH